MSWDEKLRFNASSPPREGLARMARAIVGRGARVVSVRRLRGGVDASTHAVLLEPGGWVVLKRTLSTNPRSLAREHERLAFAHHAGVPTPSPIALDGDGEWFARPALVMSRVPGRSTLQSGRGPWIRELVRAHVAVHDVDLPAALPDVLAAPHAGVEWQPPAPPHLRRSARVERLLDVAASLQRDLAKRPPSNVLLHHDFHQGNVTWRAGRLQGVVDWNEARVGPRDCDVAYCSVDLAMTDGIAVAEEFCATYDAACDTPTGDLRRWQALWIANDMRWVGYWVHGFQEAGARHLELPVLRRRLRAYADHVLARTDGH